MVCKVIFCSKFPNIPDKTGRKTRIAIAIARRYAFHANATRSPGTTGVCFSVVTVDDEHRKPRLKINCRG